MVGKGFAVRAVRDPVRASMLMKQALGADRGYWMGISRSRMPSCNATTAKAAGQPTWNAQRTSNRGEADADTPVCAVCMCVRAGCTREFHPSCALQGTYAFASMKDTSHFRFLCDQHGSPCLYCICRRPFGVGDSEMVECDKCHVGGGARAGTKVVFCPGTPGTDQLWGMMFSGVVPLQLHEPEERGLRGRRVHMSIVSDCPTFAAQRPCCRQLLTLGFLVLSSCCCRCKKHAPPHAKVKENQDKEQQYNLHEELAQALAPVRALWEKVRKDRQHCTWHDGSQLEMRLHSSRTPFDGRVEQVRRLDPQAEVAGRAATEEEFKETMQKLQEGGKWPLGLELLRQRSLERLRKAGEDVAAWSDRAKAELDKPHVYTKTHGWGTSVEALEQEIKALQGLMAQAAAFPFPPRLHASVDATLLALEWALRCRHLTDMSGEFVIGKGDLRTLVPYEGETSLGTLTDKAASKRVKNLVDAMLSYGHKYMAWEAAVAKALRPGKDRKVGLAQVEQLVDEHGKNRVKDEEAVAKLLALADEITSWENRAAVALVGRVGGGQQLSARTRSG